MSNTTPVTTADLSSTFSIPEEELDAFCAEYECTPDELQEALTSWDETDTDDLEWEGEPVDTWNAYAAYWLSF